MVDLGHYYKLPEIEHVAGFIVNAFDEINYDIHIYFPKDVEKIYENKVITNNYSYISNSGEEGERVQTSKAYRCRLKGIKIDKNNSNNKIYKKVTSLVLNFRCRCNNWVFLKISDIDIYKRMLVELIDPITKKSLNEALLDKEFYPTYSKYLAGRSYFNLSYKGIRLQEQAQGKRTCKDDVDLICLRSNLKNLSV